MNTLFCRQNILLALMGFATSIGLSAESLWIEAENLRTIKGYCFTAKPKAKTDGNWGLSGPGVAAEWVQGGESGFLSIAACPTDSTAAASLDVEIPADGTYAVWARYGDWRDKSEPFSITVEQAGRPAWTGTYGENPVIDEDNEMKLYWNWAFVWDQRSTELKKGPAKITLKALPNATAHRQLDVIVLTNDKNYRPRIKDRPADPSWKLLDEYRNKIPDLEPLARRASPVEFPKSWKIRTFNDKGFLYFWNMEPASVTNWISGDAQDVTVPWMARDKDVQDEFVKAYAGKPAKDIPIFGDDRITPTFHGVGPCIFKTDPKTGEVAPAGAAFAKWLDANPSRNFAGMMNYSPGNLIGPKGIELFDKYKARYAGNISGESVGYLEGFFKPEEMAQATANAKTRRQLADGISSVVLKASRAKYEKDMPGYFKTPEDSYADVISCLSVGNITFGPLLADWGCRTIGYESAVATSSILNMRWAFIRGLARQRERLGATYRSCNFGDSATLFSNTMSYHSPQNIVDNFYSVYSGAGMTWYKFDIWYQYMAGSSIFYHEQGFDEYWIPGGTQFGKLGLQLSPKGKLVDRFLKITRENFDRGAPYTPVAFLADYAHGWEPAAFWPNAFKNFHQHQDRFLRDDHEAMIADYLWLAYHPIGPESEKPISGTNEVFLPGVFGDIFDVIFAYPDVKKWATIDTYPVVIGLGELDLTDAEGARLAKYVEDGGTLLVAEGQIIGPGIKALKLPAAKDAKEADGYRWLKDEAVQPSSRFRYKPVEAGSARVLASADGAPFCVAEDRGKGRLVYLSVPHGMTIGKQAHPVVARLIAHLTRGLMPIEVEGGVTWLVNKNATGWMVTLLNPAGQMKPQQGITPTDYRETKTVTIKSKVPIKSAVDRLLPNDKIEVEDNKATFEVTAGGVRVIELK